MVIEKLGQIGEGRKKKQLAHTAELVNTYEPEVEDLSDAELAAKTAEFRERLEAGETLDDLLPEAFASVREAARRTIGQRHFDVQVMGAVALHQGNIAEMKTGEGKTLTSTMAAYLNSLGDGVHVVTVNDYLAKRDSEWMGPIYRALGVSVGLIQSAMSPSERRPAYAADITYGTNNEFGFDYLRDNMAMRPEDMVQRRSRVRDRGRGRLDPDRRGADPADHQRHGGRQREVVPDVRAARAAPQTRRGLRGRRGEEDDRRDGGRRREGGGGARPGQPVRARAHAARAPPPELAPRQGALPPRRRVHRDRRRGQDRRRIHGPRARGPALLRGPAPGDRGQGGRSDQGGEPDPRDDHDPELLQDVREARRHDRYGQDAARRVPVGLRPGRRRGPDQPRDDPRRPAGPDLQDRGREVERRPGGHRRSPRTGPADPRRHGLDREVGEALDAPEPPRDRAPRPEREEPREGGDDRRAGGPPGFGHGRDEHGRPWRRHPAGRQPRVPRPPGDGGAGVGQRRLPPVRDGARGAGRVRGRVRADLPQAQAADRRRARRGRRGRRALRPGHRTPRVATDRQPASRSRRTSGRPGSLAVLPLARGRPDADVRVRPDRLDHGAAEVAGGRGDHGQDGHARRSRARSGRSRS